jgi:hypothetical protein
MILANFFFQIMQMPTWTDPRRLLALHLSERFLLTGASGV